MKILAISLCLSFQQDSSYFLNKIDSTFNIEDKALAIKYISDLLLEIPAESPYLQGVSFLRLGNLYGNSHKLKLAKMYYLKAAQIGEVIGNDKLLGQGHLGVGGVLMIERLHADTENNFDTVLFHFSKALPYLRKEKDSINIEGLFSNIGYLLKRTGNYDSAKIVLKSTLQNRFILNDFKGIVGSLNNLGLLSLERGSLEDAKYYFSESLRLASSNEFVQDMAEAYKGLSKTFQAEGNYSQAIDHLYKFDSLRLEYFNDDFDEKLAESQTKFKTAEIERDNALKQAEIEQNRQQLTLLYITLGSLLLISLGFYWFLIQRRKYIKAASDKQIEDLLQQQEIKATYALLEGQDKERKRIAIELHDNLGSILTSLNMFSDALQARIDPSEIKKIAHRISDTSALANEEIRKISHSLDSGLLKHFGLEAAIRQLTEAVESAKDIVFDLELQVSQDISNENGLEIYRIIQELINNTLKHAECTRVHLEVNQIDSHLSIIFEDNGVGFNVKNITLGLGLKNIQKRVERLDGEFNIESSIGKGSTFIIEMPRI